MSVLEASGVTKVYAGEVEALRGVDLSVDHGELAAIVGPSGSGKSTLLNVLSTLERPSAGVVRIAGHDASTLPESRLSALRARVIGFVFQQFFLLDGMTATDNVANGLLYTGTPVRERRRLAAETLERVGLTHRLDHHPAQLSGGERQRVAIARALIGKPEILFADEPTGNLDSASGASVMQLLHDLHEEGNTVLVITHDRELAESLPRQIEFRDGRVQSDRRSGDGTRA